MEAIYLQYIQDAIIDKSCSKELPIKVFESWNKFSILSNVTCGMLMFQRAQYDLYLKHLFIFQIFKIKQLYLRNSSTIEKEL